MSHHRRLTIATLAASQTGYWAAKGVKRLVKRERPSALLPAVRLREQASGLGYLSGHSAVAFALAGALAPSVPPSSRGAIYAAATLVAFGRVYSGAHLPLDVAGGVGLGLLAGIVARRAFDLADGRSPN